MTIAKPDGTTAVRIKMNDSYVFQNDIDGAGGYHGYQPTKVETMVRRLPI
jgi:hypothetical protein